MRFILFLPLLLWVSCTSPTPGNEAPTTTEIKGKTFNVMAPLHVKVFNDPSVLEDADWEKFRTQLSMAREIGVAAVSVDVWWGDVEGEGDNQFDWSYYHTIFTEITNHGLGLVPILSFHQCGGNVGDDYTSLLPSWIWDKLLGENPNLSPLDLKYVSDARDENGQHKFSNEFIALWADDLVIEQYKEFMDAFKTEFATFFDRIQEINVSCGPAGELRYPSYNSHDGWSYPSGGHLQCYSNLALRDFQDHIASKYSFVDDLNQAWDEDLTLFEEIRFPQDADHFFSSGSYYNTRYGQDFIEWYNQSLISHGNRMLKAALSSFAESLDEGMEIGFKIPGIHWQMRHPESPRSAEIRCGLINSDDLVGSQGYYQTLNGVFRDLPKDKVNLHFTCLEMGNEYSGEGASEHYSRAQDLVFQVDSAARSLNIRVKGENALAGNLYQEFGWERIREALEKGAYEGITILRMGDVTTENQLGKEQYTRIISDF